MAAPTRGMLGGRLDEVVAAAAAGAAENRREEEVVIFDAAAEDASNLEDWPRQRVVARSINLMIVKMGWRFILRYLSRYGVFFRQSQSHYPYIMQLQPNLPHHNNSNFSQSSKQHKPIISEHAKIPSTCCHPTTPLLWCS